AAWESWRLVPAPERGNILFRFAQLLQRRKPELSDLMTREMGKVKAEAGGDIQEAIDMSYYMGGEGRRLFGQTTPSELRDKFMMSVRMPVGVVGAITPWNFPIAIPAWKLAPALVCGNTVVFKAAEQTPLCAQLIVEALAEAGLPPGVLNMVHGGPEVGKAIVGDRRVRAISFTGSTEVGKLINRKASEHLAKVQLEMGGKNACIVLADADLDRAARDAVTGAFGSTGQRCTATSRIVVDRKVHDTFVEKLLAEVHKTVKTGDGFEDGVFMGPLIDDRAVAKTEEYVATAKKEGNRILTGGNRATGAGLDHGFFFEPTVIDGVRPTDTLNLEEVFGPVLSILEADSLDQALEIANTVEYGLSSAIYSSDVGAAFTYSGRIEAGLLHVNCPTINSEVHLPFGGIKDSGFGGREMGPNAIDFYTEWQTMYLRYAK
ncbi:MAG: aldehyde dehydrogenase family protein, partial [Cyanobacteria bacterium REEB65]|nr:aldehyde dehydrogenase family protein [Cyanobacteria bacterium REEB65]